MTKRVLVINDDPAEQNEVRSELESDCTEVICVESVQDALRTFLNREFALVILDANLSECDGYSLLEVMQTAKPTPILALSSRYRKVSEGTASPNNKFDIHSEMSYCLKDSLRLAQRAICSCSECETVKKCHYAFVCGKDLVINPDKHEVLLKGQPLELTKTEFDILFCLAKHPGQVLSREQIYDYVWNEDSAFNVDDVVKAHIKAIRKKLAGADTQYIQNVWGVGYRFQID
ncbi:MAG: response regulator transcription factor [Lachnospiraceae bacterium]|nr:response regulator transcription factor [Lachnospiraceae bacterium]